MSRNRLVINGMAELRQALRNLPAHLTAKAAPVVSSRADTAATQVREAYPEVTGNLKGRVEVRHEPSSTRFGVAVVVRSRAPHAYMYEHGTQTRQTALGANRGAMPPAHAFVSIVIRNRRDMVRQLVAIVEEAGMVVTGVDV